MKYIIAAVIIGATMLSGCATAPKHFDQGSTQAAVNSMPAWYMKAPDSTKDAVYVAGTATSEDMAMCVEKAVLNAQVQLADRVAAKLSTMTQDYKRDTGGTYNQETGIMTEKIAADVKLIGYIEVERKIIADNNGYRAYVLLKFPLGAANTLLDRYMAAEGFQKAKDSAVTDLHAAVKEDEAQNDK